MDRQQRIAAALTAVGGRLGELRSRLAQAVSARDALQCFVDTPDWGAMASGADIAAGETVRFGLLRYQAKSAHTKALARSPLNILYWEVIT